MVILNQVRCPICNRRLADLEGYAQIKCSKCKTLISVNTKDRKIQILERASSKK